MQGIRLLKRISASSPKPCVKGISPARGGVATDSSLLDGLVERRCGSIGIIANSISAFYAMCALAGRSIAAAYFISPIVDLERIEGVTLDAEHLRYVQQHPIDWHVPTHILFRENDHLTSFATISDFACRTGATVEVMPSGEHWFTPRSRWHSWTVGSKEILLQVLKIYVSS